MEQKIGFFDFEGRKIAYATIGHGPAIVFPSWWLSHLEVEWGNPAVRTFFGGLAEESTVVRYDRIGVGLSDRRRGPSDMSLASEVAVVEALLDHLEVDRCSLVGMSCGGCIGAAYAVRHPSRVERLIVYAGYARGASLAPPQVRASLIELVRSTWGFGSRVLAEVFLTDADARERRAYVEFQRATASADLAGDLLEITRAAPDTELAGDLTGREREMLGLVARGFSEAEIAEELIISPHTAHRHIANIRVKLTLPSRAAAAAFAVRAGLG